MKAVKAKISSIQLIFLIIAFMQGSSLLISFTLNMTKQDTWVVILLAMLIFIPFLSSYSILVKRFSGKKLVQINEIVYGKYLGSIISIYYIIFFILTLSFNLKGLAYFYNTFLMSDTPLIFFLVVFTLMCAYGVYKGIEVLGRVSFIFMIVGFFILASTSLLLIDKMDFSNMLPVFDIPINKFVKGTHMILSIPFGELVVILTIIGDVDNSEHSLKHILIAFLIGNINFLVVVVQDMVILGNTAGILTSPAFQVSRIIEIGGIFTRMDILIAIGHTMLMFFKCCIFYYAAVVSLSHLLKLKSYSVLLLPIAGIAIILSAIVFQSSIEQNPISTGVGITYSIPIMFIIPPLSLLVAKIRNLPRNER